MGVVLSSRVVLLELVWGLLSHGALPFLTGLLTARGTYHSCDVRSTNTPQSFSVRRAPDGASKGRLVEESSQGCTFALRAGVEPRAHRDRAGQPTSWLTQSLCPGHCDRPRARPPQGDCVAHSGPQDPPRFPQHRHPAAEPGHARSGYSDQMAALSFPSNTSCPEGRGYDVPRELPGSEMP